MTHLRICASASLILLVLLLAGPSAFAEDTRGPSGAHWCVEQCAEKHACTPAQEEDCIRRHPGYTSNKAAAPKGSTGPTAPPKPKPVGTQQ